TYDSIWDYSFSGLNSVSTFGKLYDESKGLIYIGANLQRVGGVGDVQVFDVKTKTFSLLNTGIKNACNINSIAKWNDTLFFGGNQIVEIDSALRVDNFVKFHSGKWHPVGKGLSSASNTKSVNVTHEYKNQVLIGGDFQYGNGKYLNCIASIDSNQNINILNNQLTGFVKKIYAIHGHGDSIFIGGYLSRSEEHTSELQSRE